MIKLVVTEMTTKSRIQLNDIKGLILRSFNELDK